MSTTLARLNRLRGLAVTLFKLDEHLVQSKVLTGKLLFEQIRQRGLLESIQDAEFKIFSQFGEDGIIQYLVSQTKITPDERAFIEFGVENYTEANTRFLLMKDNWRGFIMDGSRKNMQSVTQWPSFWSYDLRPRHAFITVENVAELVGSAGFGKRFGLLSIDIDGNDYWVWEKLDVEPVIVVAEYNSVFGAKRAVSVPYDPSFTRMKAHRSGLYWGCSLKSLELLGARKGYALVGSNSAGNNAFFVRRDRLNSLQPMSTDEAYVVSLFRDSRDEAGRLTFLSGGDRANLIADMPLIDVETGARITVREAVA